MNPAAIMRFGWLLVCVVSPFAALAFRPFVSTDAAVVEKGSSEVEFGLVDFMNHRGQNTVASPAVRYNFGFATNWEFVMEGALQVYDSASSRHLELLDPQFNLKGVLIEGPLQEGHSPISLALEAGTLLPETVPDSGVGFQAVLIGSFRTGKLTWHVNGGGGLERESLEPVALWGLIVAEINGDYTRGSRADHSALIGLLWDHRKITYDAGVRFGLSKAAPDLAVSAGLTFRF